MNKQDGDEIGRIPVDSIYSPVLKVSYKVEATRVEQRTDFDKLILDVETKPAISPRDAVASAGSTLVELFGLCVNSTRRPRVWKSGQPRWPSRPIRACPFRSRISTSPSAATTA